MDDPKLIKPKLETTVDTAVDVTTKKNDYRHELTEERIDEDVSIIMLPDPVIEIIDLDLDEEEDEDEISVKNNETEKIETKTPMKIENKTIEPVTNPNVPTAVASTSAEQMQSLLPGSGVDYVVIVDVPNLQQQATSDPPISLPESQINVDNSSNVVLVTPNTNTPTSNAVDYVVVYDDSKKDEVPRPEEVTATKTTDPKVASPIDFEALVDSLNLNKSSESLPSSTSPIPKTHTAEEVVVETPTATQAESSMVPVDYVLVVDDLNQMNPITLPADSEMIENQEVGAVEEVEQPEKIKPAAEPKNTTCLNTSCKKLSKHFHKAPLFVINYYNVKYKKNNKFVCNNCFDNAVAKYEELCRAVEDFEPLFKQNIDRATDLVEISDSSEDEDDNDDEASGSSKENFLSKEDRELVENNLGDIIMDKLKKINIDKQMEMNKQILNEMFDKHEGKITPLY